MPQDASENSQPISLEELMMKRKREQDEYLRPKFLSKSEREKLIEEKNRVMGQQKEAKSNLISFKRKVFFEGVPNKEIVEASESNSIISDNERKLLKEKFLGVVDESKIKKPRRFIDKKFHFEWDAAEDTSASSPALLYNGLRKLNVSNEVDSIKKTKFDDRHWSEKALFEMTDRDWRIFKEDYTINTSGGGLPHPIRQWSESKLPSEILKTVEMLGYTQPTAIQRQAIPLALEGRDFIGVAETGSGKTASFMLPMITEIMKLPRMTSEIAGDGPYGIIVVPTRELANQIETEARKFLTPLGYKCMAIVGGHSIAEQSFHLRNGAEIIIGTPGRLRDCIDQHIIVLNQCKYVVLDEADRMIDMNFEEDLKYILDTIPRSGYEMQTSKYPMHITMFSATMPIAVERLAKTYLLKPATIQIGQTGSVADQIEQRIYMVREEEKTNKLTEILVRGEERFNPPIIVFVNQKKTVDFLTKRLESFGLRVVSLHGGKGQDQREASISLLRSGQKDILVATDVAGRGIDIKNVSLVINFDLPKSIEDYIHRVGRTGRAGNLGTSISFVTNEDSELFCDLRLILLKSGKSVIPQEFLQHEASRPQQKEGERNIT